MELHRLIFKLLNVPFSHSALQFASLFSFLLTVRGYIFVMIYKLPVRVKRYKFELHIEWYRGREGLPLNDRI